MATARTRDFNISKKLVIVGDGNCGKTCLLFACMEGEFIPDLHPPMLDMCSAKIQVEEKMVDLALFDTAGQDDYDRLRPLSYPRTDIVLMCFNVDNPTSANNVLEKWNPEIRHFCERCPVILVACKKDLRTDPEIIAKLKEEGTRPVSSEAGKRLAVEIEADAYMECSAKTREGVQDLFIQAARLSMTKRRKRLRNGCFPFSYF